MKKMKLVRLNHEKPDMEMLGQMRDYFEGLVKSHDSFSEDEWKDIVRMLTAFQAEDGSFNLLDSTRIESDCAIYYCYEPTYIGSALLIKAFLVNPNLLTGKEDIIINHALQACCERNLCGHGIDWLRDMIKAINYFMSCDVKEFLEKYPDLCPEFTKMFKNLKNNFKEMVENKRFRGTWGEDYEKEIRSIDSYFSENIVFVYGTLMKGQSNHGYYLAKSKFIGNGMISGFEMYDLGYYPGIIAGKGLVEGELYAVSDKELKAIDRLEGEGSLYIKTSVDAKLVSGEIIKASVYVYNHSVENCRRLFQKYGTEEYVWYVSYGSNLLEERLRYYIQGGFCSYNGRNYSPCTDTTMPAESRPVEIPYDMYYSNYNMGSWENSAVSFLDLSHKGKSYGRAYKIKRTQLDEIHLKEGSGSNWYPDCVRLDDIDGIEAYTFAGKNIKTKEAFSRVSAEYGIVLFKGMKETYPKMSDKEIFEYIKNAG